MLRYKPRTTQPLKLQPKRAEEREPLPLLPKALFSLARLSAVSHLVFPAANLASWEDDHVFNNLGVFQLARMYY